MTDIDQKMVAQGLTSKQHAKPHHVSVGQGQLNGPTIPSTFKQGLDHGTLLDLAIGAPDVTIIHDLCSRCDDRFDISLVGMDLEPNHGAIGQWDLSCPIRMKLQVGIPSCFSLEVETRS